MFLKIPIEIETTALGSRLKSLIELLTGPTCLKPYTYISFRVLHAMANLLQFEKAENKMNNYINANKIEAELFIYYNNDLKKQIAKEKGFWSEFNPEKLLDKFESSEEAVLNNYEENHHMFTT